MMLKKSFFKNHIPNLLTAMLISIFGGLIFSCSGMAVYFGDGADIKEELEKGHTTEYTFYLENPAENPGSEKFVERFQVGAKITPDTIQELEIRPGFAATGWIFFDPNNNEAQTPSNVHVDTENETGYMTSVSVTLNPLNFYAKGWVRTDKSIYHVRYMLQKVSTKQLSENDTKFTSGGKTYYLSYLVGEDLTCTGFADELTEAEFATSDLISGIENYTLVTTEIEQQIIKDDDSTVIEIYYDLKPFTVTLSPGSGSGTQITQTFYTETDCITIQSLATTGFSKEGNIFAGWNTKPDGSGTRYSDGVAIPFTSIPADPITLYAQWVKDESQVEITITLPDFTEPSITISGGTVNAGEKVTLTVNGTNVIWYVDGVQKGTGKTFEWTATGSGVHQIGCVVDGKVATVSITVYGVVK